MYKNIKYRSVYCVYDSLSFYGYELSGSLLPNSRLVIKMVLKI